VRGYVRLGEIAGQLSFNGTNPGVSVRYSANQLSGSGDYFAIAPSLSGGETLLLDNISVKALDTPSGTELVTNGTFDTDTDWTKGTGWTIGSGVITAGASSSGFSTHQSSTWTAGAAYRITTADVVHTAGTLQVWVDGVGQKIADVTTTESIDVSFVASNSSGRIVQLTSSSFEGTVDNISVKELDTLSGAELVTNGTFDDATGPSRALSNLCRYDCSICLCILDWF
jgi:hypothetical protein